jgi:nucleoside-diphosphate-sugar epimerase
MTVTVITAAEPREENVMRVFVTGASGWIGTHVVRELRAHGHAVIGLARSDASADAVRALGGEVLRGDLDDLDGLRRGVAAADATVHLANKHDYAHPEVSNAAERAAVGAIGEALVGTGKPFVFAAGAAIPTGGAFLTEATPNPGHGPGAPRGGSENLGLSFAERGVRSISVRFAPSVHGVGDPGFVAFLVAQARANGAALVAGDGSNRWSAVHADDAARVVRLGLERAEARTVLHAVGEEAVPTGEIAAAIAATAGVAVRSVAADDLTARYGFIGAVFGMDIPASNAHTRELLDWNAIGRGLVADISGGAYAHAAAAD